MGQEIHPMFAQYKPKHDLPDYPHNMGKMIFVTYYKTNIKTKKIPPIESGIFIYTIEDIPI